jgi:hypothetical protein
LPDVDEVVAVPATALTVVFVGATTAAVVAVGGAVVAVGGATVAVGGTGVGVDVSPPQAYSPKRASTIITNVKTIAFVCFTKFLLLLDSFANSMLCHNPAHAKHANYNLENDAGPTVDCGLRIADCGLPIHPGHIRACGTRLY